MSAGARLGSTWPTTGQRLTATGFDPQTPTVWLIEGLLQYLDESAVRTLFDRVHSLSAPKSVLLYDVVGKTLLRVADDGAASTIHGRAGFPLAASAPTNRASWQSATAGRRRSPTSPSRATSGTVGSHPAIPMDVPDVPRGYFVEATLP